jgi:hypothetical protein
MNPVKGYYSVIQYCPDLGRFEAANVGVLLFCPEKQFLRALTSSSNSRIIRFFGSKGHDWARINTFKRGLEDRLQKESPTIKSIDDLQKFIALRANVMQIGPLNPIKVQDPEEDLRRLFEEIVGEPARPQRQQSLRHYVAEKLSAPGLEEKVAHDVRVAVPVLQQEVEIPFGFQNGRFNLITPVRFGAQDPEQSVARACKYAVEGNSIYDYSDPTWGSMQLVVLGQFRAKDEETPGRVRRVFGDYRVRLIKMDELSILVDEIRRTGKPLPGKKTVSG